MTTGRALLTDREKDYLRGEEGDQRKYEAVSRVRRRIQTVLSEDIDVLEETKPELLEELRSVVCEGMEEATEDYDERALEDAREILIENNRRNQSADDLRPDDSAVETQAEKVGVSPERLISLLRE
jgi:hypothetical protein